MIERREKKNHTTTTITRNKIEKKIINFVEWIAKEFKQRINAYRGCHENVNAGSLAHVAHLPLQIPMKCIYRFCNNNVAKIIRI